MKQTLKKKIAATFTRYSETYDQYAKLQKLSADFTLNKVKNSISLLPAGPLLEIGCGSGLLSEIIIKYFPERDVTLMDISPGMLAACRKRLVKAGLNHNAIQYVEKDAESISSRRQYALIVSALTLQWFQNPVESLGKIAHSLLPGGIFICSFLGESSFREWQDQCTKSKVRCTLNPLPDPTALTGRLKKTFGDVTLSQKKVTLSYPSVEDFFLSLKKTGTAVNVSGQKNSFADMRRLMRDWHKASPEGVQVTCYIHCLVIAKKKESIEDQR
jgi:malonyl-CoA O-methyltransferase